MPVIADDSSCVYGACLWYGKPHLFQGIVCSRVAGAPLGDHAHADNSAFACSTTNGFQTCHTETSKVLLTGPAFPDGGAKIAQMIQREGSYFVALVGDGKSTLYPRNKVLVWSEAVRKFIIELGFKSDGQ